MDKSVTFYPGVGADAEIARLQGLVGQITGYWAQVEDQLFEIFVISVAGRWLVDLEPYRAVFFTFSSFEAKMRMTHNAMKVRYGKDESIITEWRALRISLNEFAGLRNEIAHLIARPKYSRDPKAKAVVRLSPPFWKPAGDKFDPDFEKRGYSWDELTQALAPFWGYDPNLNIRDTSHQNLGSRLHKFTESLQKQSS